MIKRLLVLITIFLTGWQVIQAQSTVTGVVTSSEDGLPVIGATVMVKGTQFGAVTDIDGHFIIQGITGTHKTLVVSYVGMKTCEVTLRPQVNVVLDPMSNDLEEVMVVAFGKQKRESFTGSAGVLKADKIAERQVTGVLTALNGQVSGVQMAEGNGPNGSPTIRIRGISSINAGSEPLIIVDGQPYNGYMTDINPADVESVSVLKDAASNSLYGARGANGVIMITTKTAKRGKAVISAEARWGVNHDAKVDYDRITEPGQYYEMHYLSLYNYYINKLGQSPGEAFRNANQTLGMDETNGGLTYIVYQVPEGQMLIGENGKLNPNATLGNVYTYKGREYMIIPDKWKKEGIRDGFRQEYTASINGGTDQFQFYGSLGYLSNEGLTYGSEYERYTSRMKADYQARPWLKVGANVTYTHNESHSGSSAFTAAHNIAPIFPLYIRDGQGNIMNDERGKMYDWGNGVVNGLVRPAQKNSNNLQSDVLNNNLNSSNGFGVAGYADISFLKDFKLTLNINVYDTENRIQTSTNPYYGYYVSSGGGVSAYHYRTYSLNTQQLLNWNHQYGKHTASVLLGHEYTRENGTTTGATKTNVLSYDTNIELAGAITNGDMEGYKSMYNVEGYFVRGQYDYDGKYFASASLRRDGTSRFHPAHRWGNFWSFGAAWIITREGWFQNTFVDMLKFKASFGQQGNDDLSTSHYYTNYYRFYTVNGEGTASFSSKGSRTISWETNTNLNTGFEFELFKKRVSGSIEYYQRKTTDMLLYFTAPPSIGYGGYYDNIGDLMNSGIEIDLNATILQFRNFRWSVNANMSHNTNEITFLPEEKRNNTLDGHGGYTSGYKFYGEGLAINTWYMPKYAGVNEDGESTWERVNSKTGEVTATNDINNATWQLCGDPNPKIFGGLGTNLSFFGFDLSANFLYSIGGKVLDAGYQGLMLNPYTSATGHSLHKDLLNAWTKENTDTDIPRWQFGDTGVTSTSDRFLIDGSVFTFKNVSLGYTVPVSLVKKIQLQSVRVYVSCDNVAYWSKRKGLDPRGSLSGSPSAAGYSPMRTISGGISLRF